ncbi:MAG: methionyl-tRNA formyltransferase [Chloroflexi bacterium]|nr:methionyl-tRNA formyltransferase [Chloroflexota bacterium]
MARLVFMGSPDFAVPILERLADGPHEVVGVFTQPDRPAGRGRALAPSPVKRAAVARGLPVFQPERLRRGGGPDDLAALHPDLLVVAAYGLILPQRVLDMGTRGALNVHPSLLPRWRGASPIAGAVLAGDEETGVSIMLMDAGMDTGPVLSQERTPILPGETTGQLTERLARQSADLLARTLDQWLAGALTPQPQDESRATLTRLIKKEDGELDWTRPAAELDRQVRAYQPWPGAFTYWKGGVFKLLETTPLASAAAAAPGTVVPAPPDAAIPVGRARPRLAVATGAGLLGLVRVQAEGRKAAAADDFARGARDFVGGRFEPAPAPKETR